MSMQDPCTPVMVLDTLLCALGQSFHLSELQSHHMPIRRDSGPRVSMMCDDVEETIHPQKAKCNGY